MEYQLYKLFFSSGVHFGNGSLDSGDFTFCADTLFSALCQEAVGMGEEVLNVLVGYVKEGSLLFSDAFPFMGSEYFLPKPVLHIESDKNDIGDSRVKKAYKKLKYIPVSCFEVYLKGSLPLKAAGLLDGLGEFQMKTSAAVRGLEDAMPYRVRSFVFKERCGLYVICGYRERKHKILLEELMERLTLSGIGGKRSSGLGRFGCVAAKMNPVLEKRLKGNADVFMSLSISLPQEKEMEEALDGAEYLLRKRSGFVASDSYATEWMRKRDAYLLGAGSCFRKRYEGSVLDVSWGGAHPVYRYGKPIFLGVDV